MAILSSYSLLALAITGSYLVYGVLSLVPMPTIDVDEWWGLNSTKGKVDTSIRRVNITFTSQMVDDLRYRLRNHRAFTPNLEGINFTYGFNHNELEVLVKYWAEEYPFQQRETYLNQFPTYKVNIQGLDIFFIWVRSRSSGAKPVLPLLLLHGWPGSIVEFYDTIPQLVSLSANKSYGLDIIVPCLPGFGFSDSAVRPGCGADKVAVILRNLVRKLGYNRYYIQGGDFGSIIGGNIATFFPYEVLGFHTNFLLFHTPEILFRLWYGSFYPEDIVSPSVQDRLYPLLNRFLIIVGATGYLHIQATKPDTVGVGMSDSPSALAAYILEKVATGFRKSFINLPDGGITQFLTYEQLFDNVMMYWTNNSMNTAMRLYAETFNKRYMGLRTNEIITPVPICVLQCQDDIIYLPPELIMRKFPNLLNETLFFNGGHFIAWEQPRNFSQNILDAIDRFQNWHFFTNFTWPIWYPNDYNQDTELENLQVEEEQSELDDAN